MDWIAWVYAQYGFVIIGGLGVALGLGRFPWYSAALPSVVPIVAPMLAGTPILMMVPYFPMFLAIGAAAAFPGWGLGRVARYFIWPRKDAEL